MIALLRSEVSKHSILIDSIASALMFIGRAVPELHEGFQPRRERQSRYKVSPKLSSASLSDR
jgi:hypothetical protein